MTVKVLILEDNPVARSFLCRVVRESFSDANLITEAGDLKAARRHIALTGGAQGLHGADPFKLILVDLELPDGNGMELLAELVAYPRPRSSPRCTRTTNTSSPRCSAGPTATC